MPAMWEALRSLLLSPKPYTAEQALQKGAQEAQTRAPTPAANWLLLRQACQQWPDPNAAGSPSARTTLF